MSVRKSWANEIATISGSSSYVDIDDNGNMTKVPKLDNWSSAFICVYDAWNRLVQVKDGSTTIATYSYNGLNQRVKKTVAGVTTTSFFNSQWQELESVTSGDTSVYVWGLRYIDDLVLHERGSEKLYSLADVNWNVVATANASGVVQERMKYDAFGKVAWMNSAFATKAASAYAWNRTFTGQVLDSESGLMLYRNRYYHTGLGRFISRDLIGYGAGDWNLYRYVGNKPPTLLDVLGHSPVPPVFVPPASTKKCRVSLYNESASDYGGASASGNAMKCLAKFWATTVPISMKNMGLWAATFYAKKEQCCIEHLNIKDHGISGSQWVGGEHATALENWNLKELCDSLCDGATIQLFGCKVGALPRESISALLEKCPKLSWIAACSGIYRYPQEWQCGDCVPPRVFPYCEETFDRYPPPPKKKKLQ